MNEVSEEKIDLNLLYYITKKAKEKRDREREGDREKTLSLVSFYIEIVTQLLVIQMGFPISSTFFPRIKQHSNIRQMRWICMSLCNPTTNWFSLGKW